MQSSSSSSMDMNLNRDLSVLERQRAVLQRLLQQQQQQLQHCPQPLTNNFNSQIMVNENPMLLPAKMDHCLDENLQNFSIYGSEQFGFASSDVVNTSFDTDSCSIVSTKKRKAEQFEVKEEFNDKGKEGEAREAQSEITVKSENENSKVSKVKKPDYIHVRARRGQATDNHSLAERARREKISKKMRCLQELVPGCNKVTGKAGMLDEIINYVQSLQKQVEFLSMKLGAVNPRLDFNVDNLFAKEFPAYVTNFPTSMTPLEMANSSFLQQNQFQQGGSTSCGVDTVTNGAQIIPRRRDTSSSSISTPEVYLDSSFIPQVQQLPTWDTDCQNLYNVNFH